MGITILGGIKPFRQGIKILSNKKPIWETTSLLGDFSANVDHTYNLSANDYENKSVVYTLVSGLLPPGMTLNANGTISGSSNSIGTYEFTVRASDGFGSIDKTFTINITNDTPVWQTAGGSIGAWEADISHSFNFLATDPNNDPVTYTLVSGSLPAGVTLSSDGMLSGTPTEANVFNFTIAASDNRGGSTERSFTLTVEKPSYSGDDTFYWNKNGTLYLSNFTNGSVLRTFGTGASYIYSIEIDPTIPCVFVATSNNEIISIDHSSGNVRWRKILSNTTSSSEYPGNFGIGVCKGDYIYAASFDNKLYKIAKDNGAIVSSVSLGAKGFSCVADLDGNVYAGTNNGYIKKYTSNLAYVNQVSSGRSVVNDLKVDASNNVYAGAGSGGWSGGGRVIKLKQDLSWITNYDTSQSVSEVSVAPSGDVYYSTVISGTNVVGKIPWSGFGSVKTSSISNGYGVDYTIYGNVLATNSYGGDIRKYNSDLSLVTSWSYGSRYFRMIGGVRAFPGSYPHFWT